MSIQIQGTSVIDDSRNIVNIANTTYTGTLTGSTGVIAIGTNQIYKDASGNVGIGVIPSGSYKLQVLGDVSGNTFTSTVATGTAPFTVTSTTAVTNLSIGGSSGSTVAAVTFTNTGGATSGTTFNGSTARTIDYSTLGAAALAQTMYIGTTSVAINRATADLALTGITSVTGTSTLTLNSTTTSALTIDSTTTGAINIGTNANAKTLTIGNNTGTTGIVANTGTGGTIFNTVAAGFVKVAATVAPTVYMLQIDNTGFPVVTTGVSAAKITYVGGSAAIESSASRIDITPGTLTGGTWNAFRVATSVAATTGVILNAFKANNITAGTGTDNIIYAGTGWNNILNYNGTTVINGTGNLIAGQLTGNVSVTNGGTGLSTLTANNILLGNGTAALQVVAPGTTGNVLVSTGTTWTSTAPGASGATITDDVATNTTQYIGMSRVSSGAWLTAYTASSKLYFNPSTGTTYSTVFQSLSDENKKTNIKNINNALDIVENINGVTFDWKDTELPSAGLIAQDVEKYLPELVSDSEGTKSLNYNGVIGVLVEAIKELSEKIRVLEAK